MSDNMSDKIFMYLVVLPVLIFELFFLVLGIYEIIYEIFNKNKEESNMNLYDEKNKCFVPNPPAMRYWEVITKMSTYKNISLKDAAKEFYNMSGVPPMETLEIILNSNESDLIPFESKVKICDDEDKVLSYGIQPKYAGCIAHITDIVIDEEHDENDKDDITRNRIYYLLDIDDSLYSCEILQRID